MALVVITGGARSGKSAVASALAEGRGGDVCVMVFGDADGDPEMAERIARHKAGRPEHWTTLEPVGAALPLDEVPEGSLLVVDCLGTLVSRMMAEEWREDAYGAAYGEAETAPAEYASAVEAAVDAAVSALAGRAGDTIVVTNEVGDGVVPAFALGRLFRDALGRANRRLVGAADAAWLVVAGRCIDLAEAASLPCWPDD